MLKFKSFFRDEERYKKVLSIGLILALLIGSFFYGNYVKMPAFAGTGQLTTQGDVWSTTTSTTDTIIVQKTGTYSIDVVGGGHKAGTYYDTFNTVAPKFSWDYKKTQLISSVRKKICTLSSNIYGGHLSGTIQLKKGDVIKVQRFKSAKSKVVNNIITGSPTCIVAPLIGGDAMIVYVNDTPVIGAGGCSIENTSAKYVSHYTDKGVVANKTFFAMNESDSLDVTNYYKALPVTKIANSTFSPGSSPSILYWYCYSEEGYSSSLNIGCSDTHAPNVAHSSPDYWQAASTISGSTVRLSGIQHPNEFSNYGAGTNYLNTDLCTLTAQKNDGLTPKVTVTCTKADIVVEDMYAANIRMANALEQLLQKFTEGLNLNVEVDNTGVESQLSEINSTLKEARNNIVQSTTFTAVKNKSFDIYIPIESDAIGNTDLGEIKVINNDGTDGLLQVVGKITAEGNKEVVVGNTKFVIQTIEEPDSTNVAAVLN